MASIPPEGWHVEIDHPGGNTIVPDILDDPAYPPPPNELPTVEIPVPRADRWHASNFEDATIRVYLDGDQLPIDTLDRPRLEPGRAVLDCFGGRELLNAVSKEYDLKATHKVAEDLITNETSYVANVDTPPANEDANQQLDKATSASDFDAIKIREIPDDKPLAIDSGTNKVEVLQSLWLHEGENNDGGTLQVARSDSNYSDGSGGVIESDATDPQYDFTTNYDIPQDDFKIGIREDVVTGFDHEAFDVKLDGVTVESIPEDSLTQGLDWRDINVSGVSDPISAGSHTITVDGQTNNTSGEYVVDVITAYDDRYSYTFDNTVDSDGYLSGPALYPDSVTIEFLVEAIRTVEGARIELTINNTGNNQKIEVSNDNGASFKSSSNTSTFETDFSDPGASVRTKLTLGRSDATRDTATPTTGYEGQNVDEMVTKADLTDVPITTDQEYDDDIINILQSLASDGDFLFELDHNGSDITVEWTKPGQRSSDEDPELIQYSSTKKSGPRHVFESALVKGATRSVTQEGITADNGNAVDLNNDYLLTNSEYVYTSGGTTYDSDTDYDMDYQNGTITTKSTGRISDGESLLIDYRYQTRNTFTKSGVGSPNRLTKSIKSLSSDQACGQAARILVNRLDSPYIDAEATIPRQQTNISVVEDLNPDSLPSDGGRVQIKGIETTPEQIVIDLGSRQSPDAIIRQIQSSLGSVSKRV